MELDQLNEIYQKAFDEAESKLPLTTDYRFRTIEVPISVPRLSVEPLCENFPVFESERVANMVVFRFAKVPSDIGEWIWELIGEPVYS